MVRTLFCILVVTQLPCSLAADDSSTSLDIKTGWKFSPGDDPNWSHQDFDDSQWKSIAVGSPWEEQGYLDHDGYGWYRLRVQIPSELQDEASLSKYEMLRLMLGKIDDVDQTWWNGRLIGETGTNSATYTTKWSVERAYQVPAELIRWDEENVIAVRVFDGNGDGGMYEGPYGLRSASLRDVVEIKIDIGHGNGVFSDPNEISVGAVISNDSTKHIQGRTNWLIETDEGVQVASTSIKLVLPAEGNEHVACNFSPSAPGFYRVKCFFEGESHEGKVAVSKVFGYRPDRVETELTREQDFDQYWKRTLEKLAKVDPEFKLTPKPEHDTETHQVFEVSMKSLGAIRLRGWYERPRMKGPFPALLRVPGYTENMQPTGTNDPWAVFSFNIRGHGNSQQDVSGTPEDYWIRGLDDKEDYFYRGAYSDCIRAVDFLASRDEIDNSRIAVTGGSQGGGLSLVTAALDQRISLCAPDIPFLCNWERYFKTSSWPEMDDWIDAKPYRSWQKTLRTMSYFDVLNFADRIKCPVLFGVGLQDDICPPVTIFAVYNKLPGEKQYRMYPHAGHWVEETHHAERRKWLAQHFNNQ